MTQSLVSMDPYEELEFAAAEGLMMLWRSWQTPAQSTAQRPSTIATIEVGVSSVRTPPVTRNSSPTEAHAVPEISPRPTEMSCSFLSHEQAGHDQASVTLEEVNDASTNAEAQALEKLDEVVMKALQKWRLTTSGAENVSSTAIAKVLHGAALKSARESTGPMSCSTPIVNRSRAYRPSTSTSSRGSSSRRNKENIRIKAEASDSEDGETKPCVKLVPIGDGNARVPAYVLKTIDWKKYKSATRTLLEAVFGREVLATHNLTGKPSPAFPNRVPKGKLDVALVSDIVQTVAVRSGASISLVRASITSKCADEGKLLNDNKKKPLSTLSVLASHKY